MSTVIVELPSSLKGRLEDIAKRMGISVGELLANTAEKISQAEELEAVKARARRRDTLPGFKRVLAAVPDVPPSRPDDVLE